MGARPRIAATTYTVYPADWTDDANDWGGYAWTLRIEQRSPGRWAVTDGARVYTRSGGEHEPQPSSRTDEFLSRTRMTFGEARDLALEIVSKRRINGRTFTEASENAKHAEGPEPG